MVKKRSLCIALASVVAVTSMCLLMGLRDAKAASLEDALKRIEALESRSVGNVSAPKIRGMKIGGSLRHRFEMQHEFSGTGDYTEDFTLQRFRLYFDADVNKNVRGYFKLQDVRTWGIEEAAKNNPGGGGGGIGNNGTVGNLGRVDLLEGYVELRNLGDLTSMLENMSVRIGRWQWFYGDHRLIGTLNWANEGRSYDGVRIRWEKDKNWVDVFASFVDEFDTGSDAASGEEAGRGNQDEVLWGFYSHFKVTDGIAVEPYMINRFRSRDRAGDEQAAAVPGEERFTLGARIAGKKVPWLPGVDFTFEQMLQFGDTEPVAAAGTTFANRDRDISAYAGAWGVGYTFSDVPWSPRIGYQYAVASGDSDNTDTDNDTFDHLYPTGHARLGYMDFHAFQNIRAHKIAFTAKPTKKLLLKADLWFFEADQISDTQYGVVGGVTAAGHGARLTNFKTGAPLNDREYDQELDLVFKYKLFKNFGVVGGYSHRWTDDFVEDSRGNDADADWIWLQTTLKF